MLPNVDIHRRLEGFDWVVDSECNECRSLESLRKAILVTIDGWGTNFVGAYGNSLCGTPNLDHFAANSIVFDRAYTSSSLLDAVLQSISNGQHPQERPLAGPIELAEVLQTIGKQSIFMTDDPAVAELEWVQSFNESFCFDPTQDEADSRDEEAADWTETRLAIFIEAALGELARFSEQSDGLPDWTWLHLSGLAKTWDAPYEDRLQLCDEEDDPEPPRGIDPAEFEVTRASDPDTIFGAACGAAAQAKIIDQLWVWLDAFLDELVDREECLVILTGVRGYPLGEHRSVGFLDNELYSELIHIPLIVQPGKMLIGTRDNHLVQPMSIWVSIIDWLGIGESQLQLAKAESEKRPLSTNLFASHMDTAISPPTLPPICYVAILETSSLQVPRWSAVWEQINDPTGMDSSEAIRLYLSPDDRWQQNDATSRAAEISEAMLNVRNAYSQWLIDGCPRDSAPTLPECLTRRV